MTLTFLLVQIFASFTVYGFNVDDVVYEVTSSSEKTVRVTQILLPARSDINSILSDESAFSVSIPSKVTYDGVEYSVTEIGEEGGKTVFNVAEDTTIKQIIVSIPSSVNTFHAGTLNSGGANISLYFEPNKVNFPVRMFADSYFTSIHFPEGMTEIPAECCRNTQLSDVVLPSTCKSIGDYAFAMDKDKDKVFVINPFVFNYGLETIGKFAFYNNNAINEYRESNSAYTMVLPNTVSSIGESAFENMCGTYTVFLPASLKTVPARAFKGAKYLRGVKIPEGVERIEEEAFANNGCRYYSSFPGLYGEDGAYNFSLPSTVKFVGKNAFANPQRLISIECTAKEPPVTNGPLTNDYGDVYLMVPKRCYFAYSSAQEWNRYKVQPIKLYENAEIVLVQNIKEGGKLTGAGQYKLGNEVTITAIPAKGYKFKAWMRDGVVISTSPAYTFNSITGSQQFMAIFDDGKGDKSLPDSPFVSVYNSGSIEFQDIALRRGTEPALDWEFELEKYVDPYPDKYVTIEEYIAKAVFHNAHPEKYPDYTFSDYKGNGVSLEKNTAQNTYSKYYGFSVPISETFLLQSEKDEAGNLLPSCTLTVKLPIKNKITNERDTLDYTVGFFLTDPKDPVFSHDFYSQEALYMDKGIYYVSVGLSNLDTKYGYDVEFNITETDIKTSAKKTILNDVVNVKAGELTPEKVIESGDGSNVYFGLNSRYNDLGYMEEGKTSENKNYTFSLRARNYNEDGTPREWISQSVGKSTRSVNIKDLDAVLFNNNSKNATSGTVYGEYINKTEYTCDNSYWVNKLNGVEHNERATVYNTIDGSRYFEYLIRSYPEFWGDCELWLEDSENPGSYVFAKQIMKAGTRYGRLTLKQPLDGKTHSWCIKWPDVDFEIKNSFKDCMPDMQGLYEFEMVKYGSGFDDVKNLLIIYETGKGEKKKLLVPRKDLVETENTFVVQCIEPDSIARIYSVADSVSPGEEHHIFRSGSLDNVCQYPLFTVLKKAMVMDKRTDDYVGYEALKLYKNVRNEIPIYGVERVLVKLIDAETGEQIIPSDYINVSYLPSPSSERIRTMWWDDIVTDNHLLSLSFAKDDWGSFTEFTPIIYVDGYIPYYFKNGIRVSGHSVNADGYTAHADDNGEITLTIPMRRRIDNRPFDIVNVSYRTPGVDEAKSLYKKDEMPWHSVQYSGPNTQLVYESSFRPQAEWKKGNPEQPTLSFTIVYYDEEYSFEESPFAEKGIELGPMSYLKLVSKSNGRTATIEPRLREDYTYYTDGGIKDIDSETRYDIVGMQVYYSKNEVGQVKYERYSQDINKKYTFVTYDFCPHEFIDGEKEDNVTVELKSGHRIDLCRIKNLTEDAMYMAKDLDYQAPVGDEEVADMSTMQDLKDLKRPFENFEINIPTDALLPFSTSVQKINGDYVIRAAASVNFLPDGGYSNLMDKLDTAADIDNMFYDIQRSAFGESREYAREDRALCSPTAFVGIRAWLEGRFVKDASGHYVPRPSGIGIKTEASGFASTKLWNPFFSAGLFVEGEMSTYAALEYPSVDDVKLGEENNSKFLHDVVLNSKVALSTGFTMQAGLDIYVARAICGLKGKIGGEAQSEYRYKPYLNGNQNAYMENAGNKMALSGYIKAYAEVRFMFWSKKWSKTLLSIDKAWYNPDNETNPIKMRDEGEEDTESYMSKTVLRSSVYKPLTLKNLKPGLKSVVKNIDTYAQPFYLFGGDDMVFYKMNSGDMFNSSISLLNGETIVKNEPVLSIDAASTGNHGVVAYEVSTADRNVAFDQDQSANHLGIKVSSYNGGNWQTPVMISSSNNSNFTPRTAVDAAGNAAVVWKGGEYIKSEVDSLLGGRIEGNLYVNTFDGKTWSGEKKLVETTEQNPYSDYAVAMKNGKPVVLATVGKTESANANVELETQFLASVTLGEDNAPRPMIEASIFGSNPQLVTVGESVYGAVMSLNANEQSDIRLLTISDNGLINDLGMLGLNERQIIDYKLVTDKDRSHLGLIWKEATKKYINDVDYTVSVSAYTALINKVENDDKEYYFVSCPQVVTEAEEGLDISYFDAYIHDGNKIMAAVTLFDSNTGGANVVEKDVTFENTIAIQHAAIDTKVEKGKDFGYYVVVFNEGYEAIDYVDMQFGDDFKHTYPVSIYPGTSEKLSDMVFYQTKLGDGIVPVVTPHFTSNPLVVRDYTTASKRTKSMLAKRSVKKLVSTPDTPLKLQVVDLSVNCISNVISGDNKFYEAGTGEKIEVDKGNTVLPKAPADNYTTVLLTVSDNSPIDLKNDYKANVALYLDPNGLKPYKYAHDVNIPASELKAANGSKVARILIGKVPEDIVVYAVVHTIDAEGNVITDQELNNNSVAVSLKKNDLTEVPSGVEEIIEDEKDVASEFVIENTTDGIKVSNLTIGRTLRVYNINGTLVNLYKVTTENEHSVKLPVRGIYIVTDSVKTVKIKY